MRHTLNTIGRMLLCAVGFVMSLYGTVRLDGLGSVGFAELMRKPDLWIAAAGGLLTAVAFVALGRSQAPADPQPLQAAPEKPEKPEKPETPEKPERPTDSGNNSDKLSLFEVVGLAAGGVIGSGWLLAVPGLHESLGDAALLGWAAGGVLMLTIAVVMVEFGLI